MPNVKQTVPEPEKSGAMTRLSGQRQSRQEVVSIVQNYFESLDNLWDVPVEQKEQEIRRFKLLVQYQIALSSPLPVARSIIERSMQTGTGAVTGGYLSIPANLRKRLAMAAKELNCTENDAALVVLSEGVSKYGQESEEDDESEEDLDI